MYYNHNIHFLAVARAEQGQFAPAIAAARELAANIAPALAEMPMLQQYATIPWSVLLRFRRWDEMLQVPEPDAKFPLMSAVWHFTRGAAQAGKGNVAEARREQEQFAAGVSRVPADAAWNVNPASGVLKIAAHELGARIAEAAGSRNAAIDLWRKAVAAQDLAGYDEPPPWYYSTRESLGGALLRAGRAAEAEAVFREELNRNPRGPRALFGLLEALKAQNKPTGPVERQFQEVWARADQPLTVQDL